MNQAIHRRAQDPMSDAPTSPHRNNIIQLTRQKNFIEAYKPYIISWVLGTSVEEARSLQQCGTLQEYEMDIITHVPDRKSKAQRNGGADQTSVLKSLNDSCNLHMDSCTAVLRQRFDPCRIWAIVIGIDGYSLHPLRGCVADASAMKRYIINDLGVSEGRIQTFLGPRDHRDANISSIPSRANIVSALCGLSINPNIKHGDPIIFYFAGHGSRYAWSDLDNDEDLNSSKEHSNVRSTASPRFIEALCPVDRDAVPDISDRELNTIFSQISSIGGHPITVILDCCHGGGATRSPVVRTISSERDSLRAMLHTGEEDLENFPGHQSILAKDWRPDADSHVIVAACKESEFVTEVLVTEDEGTRRYGGAFTSALLNTLRSGRFGEGTTYEILVEALPTIPFQTPIAAGRHKNACLWYQVRRG